MTVTTTLDRQYFNGDGSNKAFPFNFRFFTNDQIYVSLIAPDGTITPQSLTTNYTLSGALQAGGGTVTMLVAPPLTVPATRVFIQRVLSQTQPTSIRNQGKFYPEIHEDAFDRLTMLIQQALAGLGNSLQLTFSKTGWNFLGYRGINAGDPINDQDVTTKSWVANQISGANGYAYSLYLKSLAYAESLVAGVVGGYGSFMQGGIGAIIRTFQGKMREQVSVSDFGDVEGGVVDAGAAVQRALDYLATLGGGELIYPPGVYKHITTPKLPVNLPRALKISCYGAELVAVAGGRIFDINKFADHDTLQNVEICGPFIDFRAMTGRNHVIAGTYVNGTIQTRINFRNNTLRDIRGIGPDPDPSLVNHVICVYFQCAHPTSREAIAGFVDDTTLDNVKMTGGNAGYLILGNSLASTDAPNISMSTVNVINCEHKITIPPAAFFASSSLHIGLDAIVKSARVVNFYGENPGDNGIELNNVRSATVELARIKNPQNVAYYIDNKNPDFDSTSQIITYDTCIGDHGGYGARTFQVGPYVTDGSGGSEIHGKIGQVNYLNCGTDFTAKGPTAGGFAINGGISGQYLYDSINIENYKVTAFHGETLVSNQFPAAFSFRSSGPTRVLINGVEWELSGAIVQGGFIFRPRLVNLFGPDMLLSLSGVRGTLSVSGVSDVFRMVSLELGKATVFARNNKVVSSVPCTMLYLNPADGLDSSHKAILSDSDWSGAGAVLAATAGGTDQFRFARVKDVQVAAPLGMVALGPGASPRTITNFSGYQQQIFVSGGTGVSIELDVGTGVFVGTGQAAGGFMLSAGQSIRITHTTQPTITAAHLGT